MNVEDLKLPQKLFSGSILSREGGTFAFLFLSQWAALSVDGDVGAAGNVP